MPCLTISGAQGALPKVTATRTFIKIRTGTYVESVVIDGSTTAGVVLVGEQGAAVTTPTDANLPIIHVQNGAAVSIRELTIRDSTGGVSGNLNSNGVVCDAGSVELAQVEVSGNSGTGVTAGGCPLSIARSIIRNNGNMGIFITESRFSIINSFIANNTGRTVGGVGLVDASDPPPGPNTFAFNTIADNVADASGNATQVDCVVGGPGMVLHDNIVWTTTTDPPSVHSTGCTWNYSLIAGGQTGQGNIDAVPDFIVPGTDYHIKTSSPARNAGDPAATLSIDFDGDLRPQGLGYDMGADEAP